MMKSKRRWREKRFEPFIASGHKGGRVHDFLKGWGTICRDGSILWDHYRPPTKREIERARKKREKFFKNPKIEFPMIKTLGKFMPELIAEDIVSVQPMSGKILDGFVKLTDEI